MASCLVAREAVPVGYFMVENQKMEAVAT